MQLFGGQSNGREDAFGDPARARTFELDNLMRMSAQLEETRAQVIYLREALHKCQEENMHRGAMTDNMRSLSDVQQIHALRSELDNYVRQQDLDRRKIRSLESQLDDMRAFVDGNRTLKVSGPGHRRSPYFPDDSHMFEYPESETFSPTEGGADNDRNPMLRKKTPTPQNSAGASRAPASKKASLKKIHADMISSSFSNGSQNVEPPRAPEESEASVTDSEGDALGNNTQTNQNKLLRHRRCPSSLNDSHMLAPPSESENSSTKGRRSTSEDSLSKDRNPTLSITPKNGAATSSALAFNDASPLKNASPQKIHDDQKLSGLIRAAEDCVVPRAPEEPEASAGDEGDAAIRDPNTKSKFGKGVDVDRSGVPIETNLD